MKALGGKERERRLRVPMSKQVCVYMVYLFLVRECLVSEVEFITSMEYEESVWMKVRSRR